MGAHHYTCVYGIHIFSGLYLRPFSFVLQAIILSNLSIYLKLTAALSFDMASGLMTNDQKITVKRRYLKPIAPDPEFEKMTKATRKYMIRERSRMCITCNNPATQLLCSDVDGALYTERYCQACIDANKHLAPSELMANFDNLFTRAVPGNTSYTELHKKTPEFES